MESIFQTPEWEEFKLETGYQKSFWVDDVLVLVKKLPLGGAMMYTPRACSDQLPVISTQEYQNKIKQIATRERAIFYRLELDVPIKSPTSQESRPTSEVIKIPDNRKLITDNYIKSFEEMQPEHTLILNLEQSEEEILAQMKPKGRYNIKVAERSGIQIQTSKSVDNFYKLYETMSRRQNISYRGQHYFETLVDIFSKKDYILVFEAAMTAAPTKLPIAARNYENTNSTKPDPTPSSEARSRSAGRESGPTPEVIQNRDTDDGQRTTCLASAIVSFYGKRATYLFGGSSDEQRNLMAPYKLQWEIIKEAKKRGMREYDFFGVAPEGVENHPWAGVTRFKEQFGGKREDILGSYDLVFNKLKYNVFKVAEKIRR